MRSIKNFAVILLIFIVCRGGAVTIKNVNSANGLSDDYVLSVIQDSYGYIWFGTYNGLNRYDGNNMKVFRSDPDDTSSLSNNFINALFEDNEGNLWIGTAGGGLCKYDREKQHFLSYRYNSNNDYSIISNNITAIAQDSKGRLWLGTMNGICYYNPETGNFRAVDTEIDFNLIESMLSCLFIDSNDNIWIGTRANGILMINANSLKSKTFRYDYSDTATIADNMIRDIKEDSAGNIWIASYTGGISKIESSTDSVFRISNAWDNLYNCNITNILTLTFSKENTLWFGTKKGEIFRYNPKTDTIPTLVFKKSFRDLNEVRTLIIDKNETIWAGTAGSGILKIDPDFYSPSLYNRSTYSEFIHPVVTCFAEDESENIWFGTDGGGIQIYNRMKDTLYTPGIHLNENEKFITDIQFDSDYNLWIATWGGGIVFYDRTSNIVRRYIHKSYNTESLSTNNIKGIFYDKETDLLWIATHGFGLNIINTKNDSIYNSTNNTLVGFNLFCIRWCYDMYRDLQDDRIWIISGTGVYAYSDDTLTWYSNTKKDKHSINSNLISDLYQDSDGIFVATRKGISKFDPASDNFIPLFDSLDIKIEGNSILRDNDGNFWLTVKDGILKCNGVDRQTILFDKNDNLINKSFYPRSKMVTSRGEYVFGSYNGFNIFSPDSLKRNTDFPVLYISSLEIFFKEQLPGRKNSVLKRNIMLCDTIEIPYEKSVISISYNTIEYSYPENIQYKYRLLGFNEMWNNVSTEEKATFTNLNPGEYKFQVRSTNANGQWNDNSVNIIIKILPPWYLTIWFKIGLALAVSLLIFAIFYYRITKERKERKHLDKMVKLRTAELEEANIELLKQKEKEVSFSNEIMKLTEHVLDQNQKLEDQKNSLEELNNTKNKFFSIIAHDLKNPLNGLIGFADLLRNNSGDFDDKQRQTFIGHIYQSSVQLYDLLVNLLNWARTQSGTISYSPEALDIKAVVESNILLIKANADRKKITVENEVANGLKINADINMINAIIRNLLLNAIKYTPQDGMIFISTEEKQETVIMKITDTGVGMDKSQITELFKIDKYSSTPGTAKEKGTGLGLIICSEFMKINNGTIKVESKKGEGSSFILEFPKA